MADRCLSILKMAVSHNCCYILLNRNSERILRSLSKIPVYRGCGVASESKIGRIPLQMNWEFSICWRAVYARQVIRCESQPS